MLCKKWWWWEFGNFAQIWTYNNFILNLVVVWKILLENLNGRGLSLTLHAFFYCSMLILLLIFTSCVVSVIKSVLACCSMLMCHCLYGRSGQELVFLAPFTSFSRVFPGVFLYKFYFIMSVFQTITASFDMLQFCLQHWAKVKGKLWTELKTTFEMSLVHFLPTSHVHTLFCCITVIISSTPNLSRCLQCFDTVGWAAGRASGL